MKPITLPEGLLLGSATAATQIEGGDIHSNWYHWGQQGRISGNASPIEAADHYNRYPEDIRLMQTMHHQIYRMSIEWSRIEPQEDGWSEAGIRHYQDEIRALRVAGIQPLVTLHHFSHPQWFEDMGAWTNPNSVDYFIRFVERVVQAIGHDVAEYCTINEPNVFVNDTYMDGKYPPGHHDDTVSYFKASKNLILAHLHAYRLIHRLRQEQGHNDTKVGFAHHLAYFECSTSRPINRISHRLIDYAFHTIFFNGMVEGRLSLPLGRGYPMGKGVFCDFIGINYYSRHLIYPRWNPAAMFGEVDVEHNLPRHRVNDLGWEIYPEGLYAVTQATYQRYGLPIYITENGIPDATDSQRARFIYDHIAVICRLIDDGVDVQRYYHWSLLDNLEWNDGYGPRFGLVAVDYTTQKRTIRSSGQFYGEMIRSRAVTQAMIDAYWPDSLSENGSE